MEIYKKTLTIAGNPISDYKIIHGTGCYPAEETAAKELQKYIALTTGVKLEICYDTERPTDREIIIGKTNREGDGYEVDREKYYLEGYMILVNRGRLIITGGKRRGAMYGVYDFLEKYIGWRFYTLDLEKCKGPDIIDIPEGEFIDKVPKLEYRELDWICARDKKIAVKYKINGNYRDFGPDYGGELSHYGGEHSIGEYIPIEDRHNGQPCLSDPENIKIAIERVGKVLERHPDIDILEISQEDNQNYCTCDRCKQIDEEEGNHAGTLIRFINALSDAYREKYPRLHFETFAYQYTRRAPQKTKPRDNIIIKLCPMECCQTHPYDTDDPTCNANILFRSDFETWQKVCKKIYIWDYSTNYSYFIFTFPNFRNIQKNVKYLVDNNVAGIYVESNYISRSGEFAELRAYLQAKMMWDPDITEEQYYELMYDFMKEYYGPGWENIKKFIDFACDASSGNHTDLWSHPSIYIHFDVYEKHLPEIKKWWADAEELAETDQQKANVARSRLQVTLIELTLEHQKRFVEGDDASKRAYCFDNQKFYNTLVHEEIAWREAYQYPYLVDFTKPPLDWCQSHYYGQPEPSPFVEGWIENEHARNERFAKGIYN